MGPNQFIISSFNWDELEIFYNLNKKVPIAILTGADPLDAIPIAKKLNALAINPSFSALNIKNVKKIQRGRLQSFSFYDKRTNRYSKNIGFRGRWYHYRFS